MPRICFILMLLWLGWQGAVLATELRGAWIHSPTGIVDKRGWDATVKVLAENGYNALFANLAWGGCAEYPSGVVAPHPSLYDREGNCHDRLQECLDACRKYGIQLHVWVVVCNLGDRTPKGVREQLQDEGRLQVDAAGEPSTYLAPHLPENRVILRELAVEIVTRYPVDGLHLDYIRYPFGSYDFSASAREDFERSLGHAVEKWPEDCQKDGKEYSAFLQWRRENITELLREIHDAVKEVRPDVQLTAAVYGYWPGARVSVAQEAERWAKEGLVDALCPMNYSKDTVEAGQWLRQQLRALDGAVPVYAGLANYMTASPEELVSQIKDARKCGADGFVTFQLKPDFADQWLPYLHTTVTQEPAVPPLRGNEVHPTVDWDEPPFEPPWRLLRFWKDGDRIGCIMRWADEKTAPSASTEIQFRLLHNGARVERYRGGWRFRKDGALRIVFVPEERGYYRWEMRWQDAEGNSHECRTSTRYVH